MKAINLIISIVTLLILATFAYSKLSAEAESSLPQKTIPVDSKEFVWVRMDSLSRGLSEISGTEISIDSTKNNSYIIHYSSKQFLLHERVEGIEKNRKHLLDNSKDFMSYKEDTNGVEISLKKDNRYVYCPVLILDRILYWKSKQ